MGSGAAFTACAPVLCAPQVSSILPASTYRRLSRLLLRRLWNDRATYHACLRGRAFAHSSQFVPTKVRCPARCRSNLSVECLARPAANRRSNLLPERGYPAPGWLGCKLAEKANRNTRGRAAPQALCRKLARFHFLSLAHAERCQERKTSRNATSKASAS